MIVGLVMGAVWGAKRAAGLEGRRLLAVRPLCLPQGVSGPLLVEGDRQDLPIGPGVILALDSLGAGKGEVVILSTGSRVRDIVVGQGVPVKTVVLAIVDRLEIAGGPCSSPG